MQRTTHNIDFLIEKTQDVKKLFPPELIKIFLDDGEEKLFDYVLILIDAQHDDGIKFQILLKAATINVYSETLNYWVIKKAVNIQQDIEEMSIKSNKQIFLRDFLLDLLHYIPQSTFLWFCLQELSKKPVSREDWLSIFSIHKPTNISQTMNELNPEFALTVLTIQANHTADLMVAYIEYSLGNFKNAFESCKTILDYEIEITPNQRGLVTSLSSACLSKINNNHPESIRALLYNDGMNIDAALHAIDSKKYHDAIKICDYLISCTHTTEIYSHFGKCIIYGISAKCHELTEQFVKAINLHESVYPLLNICNENTYGLIDLTEKSIVRVRTDIVNGYIDDNLIKNKRLSFFKHGNHHHKTIYHPKDIYGIGIVQLKKKHYFRAIQLFDHALILYIREAGFFSKESAACYSKLASCHIELNEIDIAHIKCNMAYHIAYRACREDAITLLIEIKLRQIEVTLSQQLNGDNSLKCANAYEYLAFVYENAGKRRAARKAYEACHEIYYELFGESNTHTQEILTRIHDLSLHHSPRVDKLDVNDKKYRRFSYTI